MQEKGTKTVASAPDFDAEVNDRIRGLIFGAACGNSLGGASVGLKYRDISGFRSSGVTGVRDFADALAKSGVPDHKAGELLADSLLGLALADSLISSRGRLDETDLKKRYGELLENEAFLKSSPGAACLTGLRKMVDGTAPAESGAEALHPNVAARVFAAGALPGGSKTEEPVDIAIKQAKLSHGDNRSVAAAAVVADSIRYFVAGGKLETAEQVRAYVSHEFAIAERLDDRFAESWDDVAPDLDYSNPPDDLPYSLINVESTITELVPTAVGIFLIFRHDPEEAICAAARSGGDTDTVATIVGALSGAYHGAAKLPKRWTSKIGDKERLEEVARQLAALWT
ncbi:MAG: ADP-ribosylglycohydrolase family protein [Candidatus Melainabacteria bacterium]|nr:ADP-ribosylglycohydrolase family protein [Candidatus Melainabacteria bacterium]